MVKVFLICVSSRSWWFLLLHKSCLIWFNPSCWFFYSISCTIGALLVKSLPTLCTDSFLNTCFLPSLPSFLSLFLLVLGIDHGPMCARPALHHCYWALTPIFLFCFVLFWQSHTKLPRLASGLHSSDSVSWVGGVIDTYQYALQQQLV